MNIVVVGGGRMGLPLASLMADNGGQVTVCDINPAVVDTVNAGDCPYEEPHLGEYIARNVAAGRLNATTDTTGAVKTAEAVVVIVPAWLTPEKDIDYTVLKEASTAIAKGLQRGALVSYETTVNVSGVRTNLIPVLEQESGMKAGADFSVSFSPERVKANLVFARLQETPKVVGGFDEESGRKAEELYSKFLGAPVINVGSLEGAELTKLIGMLYRDVNIALVNELAAYSEAAGIDFELVRDAANTNGEAHLLSPGIGVGGHCTPVYPWFVINDARRRGVEQQLATSARHINDDQPCRNVARVAQALGGIEGKRVHIMGLGFRPDVKVDAFSTAYPLREAIEQAGASPTIEDPFYSDAELQKAGFELARIGKDALDAVILNTAHTAFLDPDFPAWRRTGVTVALDGRNAWDRVAAEAAGVRYLAIGRPE